MTWKSKLSSHLSSLLQTIISILVAHTVVDTQGVPAGAVSARRSDFLLKGPEL